MEELCTACLCSGRKLYFINETGFEYLYSQIINEIPIYNITDLCVRVCWECKALLRKIQTFKEQVKNCYSVLLQYFQQNVTKPYPSYPRLRIQRLDSVSFPIIVKQEIEDQFQLHDKKPTFHDDAPIHDDDVPIYDDDDFEVKSEETHCEPETFVKDLNLDVIAKKRGVKKTDKPIKEKTKRKSKSQKEVKKKIKLSKKLDASAKVKRSSRTVKSLIDTTVIDCYTKKEENGKEDGGKVARVLIEVDIKRNGNGSEPVASKERLPDRPTCAECGKTFSSRKTYRYHLNVLHKGQNRYPCPRCDKVYQWKSNLGRHMRSHKARDSGELYCEKCDKRFASVATYRQHLRISRRHVSESEFSFMCNECGKKFVNKTRLRDHIDWEHLKKIKFKCQLCNKPFKCHTSLYVHMQNVHHSKDKKENLCHVCGKSYQNAAKLKYHIVAMHTSETPYQCQRCNAAFGWYSSLYRHVREVHYKMKVQTKKSKKPKKSEILPSLLPVMPQQLNLPPIHQPGPP